MIENKNPYNQQRPPMPMPPIVRPMGRRARWGAQLMSGAAARIISLPNWVITYMLALAGVSMIYSNYAMEWYFGVFGIMWVAGFFFLSAHFSREWNVSRVKGKKSFEKKLFWTDYEYALQKGYISSDEAEFVKDKLKRLSHSLCPQRRTIWWRICHRSYKITNQFFQKLLKKLE